MTEFSGGPFRVILRCMTLSGRLLKTSLAVGLAALLSGCAALLPASDTEVIGPWRSFADAQKVFQSIQPYKTTRTDLKSMGLDLETHPNITLLNYSDVIRRFVPPVTVDGYRIDKGVADCIASNHHCRAYEIDHKSLKRDRYGNFWADFFNFRRLTKTTGWTFNAVVLLKDDVVVYALTGGQPLVQENESKKNPLGPLQGVDTVDLIR